MHDIDSTRLEFNPEYEYEYEYEGSGDTRETNETQSEAPMSEAEEEAFAAELLGVSNEMEMDHFLGGLFKKIAGKIGGAASKFLGKAGGPLAGALKGIAAKALPFLGGALGTAIPIPGVGTALGTALGSAASNLLQSELENLEAEEQEFEAARRFVRLATHAVRHGARRPFTSNPVAAANLALRHTIQRWRRSGGYGRWGRNSGWGSGTYGGWPAPGQYPAGYGTPSYGAPENAGGWPSGSQYPPCPPPPLCPVCNEPSGATPAGDLSSSAAPSAPPPAASGAGSEMEFGYSGEAEGEGESYENYESSSFPTGDGGRSGRWVRRGRKIILYGA